MTKPVVAIVGRPNVGKSTLFNRIAGRRKAIVEDLPGTTRDRLYADVSWNAREFSLMDTGGLELKPGSGVGEKVKQQIEAGIAEADLILFVLDARDGLLADDWEIADVLRRSGKPMILLGNKIDGTKRQAGLLQLYELGMGEPLGVSGYHGRGVDELLDRVVKMLPPTSPEEKPVEGMRVAIVGRPNVGKSMLLNAILGQDRTIVDDVPGTTRDAVDTVFEYSGQRVVLVDTAGIRRRGKIEQGVEQHSIMRGREAIEASDVALLVIDATEGLSAQDTHILGYAKEAYKAAVIVVNKWDLVVGKETAWRRAIISKIRFMAYVPIMFTSAKTGYGVGDIVPTALRVYGERLRQLPDPVLDNAIREIVAAHAPPAKGVKHVKVNHVSQTGVNPPTFVFRVNNPQAVHFTYQRYLENSLRQRFGFEGTPLRLIFKGGSRKRGSREKQPAADDRASNAIE